MTPENYRILAIDDNEAIHEDFRKILTNDAAAETALAQAESVLFDEAPLIQNRMELELDSAHQGQEGVDLLRASIAAHRPYAMAFVDVRMPPGMDGIETVQKLWEVDPDLQVVICTAYSDYSWNEIIDKLGNSDRLLILKKPFDPVEVLQLAHALTKKWMLTRQVRGKLDDLERIVNARTLQLQITNEKLLVQVDIHKQSEARLRLQGTALESAANAIVITDKQGIITWVNPAFAKLSGYQPEEVIGQNPRILKSGRHDAAFYKELWDTILSGKPWAGEVINCRKDGTTYTEQMTVTPVCDEHAQITHFIAVKEDITQRKQLEEQLLQAQKIEAVGRLAGGVAHDFNNILTAITGYSQLMLNRLDDREWMQKGAEEIEKAAYRAARLTRQLLAFSRKQVFETKVLDLRQVVAETEQMLRRLISEHIDLETRAAAELGHVKADPNQLEQVIMNLVVNARDAMPEAGTITLHLADITLNAEYVRQYPEVLPGEYVMLAVQDTGAGMSREVQAHIFEPFFTTKDKAKGTGLGLATVYGIVKQSGGHISVESELGKGTTFKVFLPRVLQALDPTKPRETSTTMQRGSGTVLLVEDEAMVRELASRLLKELGYTVLTANNGEDALRVVEKRNGAGIDVVVTDVVMPKMGGKALADRLRAQTPAMKIIFTSGYTEEAIVPAAGLAAGMAFVQKPYTPSTLARKIREMLDSHDPAA